MPTMLARHGIERVRMSKEEYFRQASLWENGLVDWEDGEAVRMPPAHSRHGFFILRLGAKLDEFTEQHGIGRVWQELFVDFGSKAYGVDLAMLMTHNLDRHAQGRIQGAPDLIVEVISDDSRVRDRSKKFHAYYSFSVPWYWIGDPVDGTLEEYHHTPDGYARTVSGTLDCPFQPRALPGFEIALNRLVE
ncbi:MAG: Uma2 family endonuclease [Candidatus Xenobia bacterium]